MTLSIEELKAHYKVESSSELETKAAQRSGKWPSYFNPIPGLDIEVFVAKEGDNIIRIVPARADDDTYTGNCAFGIEIQRYYIGNQSILGADTIDKSIKCPVKAAYFDAHRRQDEVTKRQFQAVKRELVFIEDWTDKREGESPKLKLFEMPTTLRRELESRLRDKKTGHLMDITHPTEGRCVSFERIGTKLDTRYSGVEILRGAEPLQALYELPKFSEILKVPTVDEMEKVVANATEYNAQDTVSTQPTDESLRVDESWDGAMGGEPTTPSLTPLQKLQELKKAQMTQAAD